MGPDGGHGPPPVSRPPGIVDRAQRAQRGTGHRHRRDRRRVEEREPRPVGMSPTGQLQRKVGKVGHRDLRLSLCREPVMFARRPAPIDPSRRLPAGPPATLVRRRARHPHGHQAAQATRVIGTRYPAQAGVDNDPHRRDSKTALGDRAGQHHPAAPARTQRRVLHTWRQPAV